MLISKKLLMSFACCIVLSACQSPPQTVNQSPNKLPAKPPSNLNCSAPPPIENIWKLEPMLVEQGLIKPEMSKQDKETVIREYIRKKNAKYQHCRKGK